jgi:hypothetical protein
MQACVPTVCDECQGEVHLVTSVASFGGSPGARFFQCKDCGHLHIEDLSASFAPGSDDMDFRPEGA